MTSPHTPSKDEFYVHYGSLPSGYRRFLLGFIPLLLLGAILFAGVLPRIHNQLNPGKINGVVELEGLLLGNPAPHLVVPRPGNVGTNSPFSRYILSGTDKKAPATAVLNQVGKWVKLKGIAVSRNQLSVIATFSAQPIEPPKNVPMVSETGTSLGRYSLTGEILDGKCYPGIMKPGQGKTHRACAIRCLSGGVPAVFRVHNHQDDVMYFLLTDEQGQAVNEQVLDWVADPIEITGEVVRYDDMFVIRADPTTYQPAST